jgi:hypothetical protein
MLQVIEKGSNPLKGYDPFNGIIADLFTLTKV